MTIRVLMVGKSDEMMARMAASMGPDFTVSYTQDVEKALADSGAAQVDVVVLGRALNDAKREALRAGYEKGGHRLAVINSLGPLGELVGAQVRAAYAELQGTPMGYQVVGVTGMELRLEVTEPTTVTATVYRVSALWRLTTRQLFSGELQPGAHTLPVPRSALSKRYVLLTADGGQARFVAVPRR